MKWAVAPHRRTPAGQASARVVVDRLADPLSETAMAFFLCDGRNSQRYATLAATLDDESWDTTLGIQPLSVSAFHFSREPGLEGEAGSDRIRMELNAPSAALTDPTPFPNQGGFFKQRWLDRQDVITSHVLRLIDPIENQQLHFLFGSDLSHVSRVRGSYFWVQQIY
jgi:hypothetical protein